MSPAKKVPPVSSGVAKSRPLEARHEMGSVQSELAFLLVGGIALFEGLALVLLALRAK
jgi:hypothetical protein